jgi:hypothetical protein
MKKVIVFLVVLTCFVFAVNFSFALPCGIVGGLVLAILILVGLMTRWINILIVLVGLVLGSAYGVIILFLEEMGLFVIMLNVFVIITRFVLPVLSMEPLLMFVLIPKVVF